MFLRKLTVIAVPLLMVLALNLLAGAVSELGFFSWVIGGVLLGAALALVLPLSGAVRRRERFGGLLWIPAVTIALVVFCQYMQVATGNMFLSFLATRNSMVIMIESAFVGFLVTTCVRTIE
ncbi:MAG: hypothetical protein Q4C54_01455 [Clostridia bacterium]|nr:hypothetical protein [Clostridia bacterium]